MARIAFKNFRPLTILIIGIAVATVLLFVSALLWDRAFDTVNLVLKLALIVLPAAAAGVGHFQAKSDGKRFSAESSITLLWTAALIGVLSFLLDSSAQRRATQQAIDRQTAVIANLERLVHPLNGSIWASFSFTLDADQKSLGPLRVEARARAYVGGKRKYGFIMLNPIDRADPNLAVLRRFLDAAPPTPWFFCSRSGCDLCRPGFNPKDPRGVDLIAEVPQRKQGFPYLHPEDGTPRFPPSSTWSRTGLTLG